MHAMYGTDVEERICADCPHLINIVRDKIYYKCTLYGVSNSEATDWRRKWQACALLDHDPDPDNFVPVLERLKHMPRSRLDKPINGQISIAEVTA